MGDDIINQFFGSLETTKKIDEEDLAAMLGIQERNYEDFIDEFFGCFEKSGYTPIIGIISKYFIDHISKDKVIRMVTENDSSKNLNRLLMIDHLIPLAEMREDELFSLFDTGIEVGDWGDFLLINYKDYLLDNLSNIRTTDEDVTIIQSLLQATVLDIINNPLYEGFISKITKPRDLKTILMVSNTCRDVAEEINKEYLMKKVQIEADLLIQDMAGLDLKKKDFLYFTKAKKLLKEGELDACENYVKLVISSNPLSVDSSRLYSQLLYKQGRFSEALSELEQIFPIVSKKDSAYEELLTLQLKIMEKTNRPKFIRGLQKYISLYGAEKAERTFETKEPLKYIVSIKTGKDKEPIFLDVTDAMKDDPYNVNFKSLLKSLKSDSKPGVKQFLRHLQKLDGNAKLEINGEECSLSDPLQDYFQVKTHKSKDYLLLEGAIREDIPSDILNILGG